MKKVLMRPHSSAIHLALKYAIHQMKGTDFLSILISCATSLLFYSFWKGFSWNLLLIAVIAIALYFIALVVIGLMEEGKDVDISVAVSKGKVSLKALRHGKCKED
ncbi:hypothetical protein [Candidatus Methanodesulfokora washburnensis]|jgi:hypothetical protein|uniref:Uncharacterized protein n=1 Tax=Candidatus Methanodesulfokora washburnensis TaxID=2478471 RepID=A0A429GQZ1_9CREN|nr:hypothetical protein [Candidatus Methanodesulfokores washburnensis]RSN76472.1 hypothetical protein D6D85_04000 [Candidatus Methanodesulfokores washburnensis]